MSTRPVDRRDHPAVRNYAAVCLAALLVLFLVLVDRGLGAWSLLPVLAGAAALALNWSTGPPLVLLSVSGLIAGHDRFLPESFRLTLSPAADLALCTAVLAYVAGFYRLRSLAGNVFPEDPRTKERMREEGGGKTRSSSLLPPPSSLPKPDRSRSPERVAAGEAGWLVLVLPLWALLACLTWWGLTGWEPLFGIDDPVLFGLLLLGTLGAGVALAGGVLRHQGWARATPEEALLYLHDQVWHETARDQGRLSCWLAWARLRRRARKEES